VRFEAQGKGRKAISAQSAFLFGVFAARAYLWRCREHGPAAVFAVDDRLAQHAAHQRTTTSAAAWTGADTGALADLLESLGARLNSFDHRALADLVADTCGFKILNNRLLSCLPFQFVDGNIPSFTVDSLIV
jgi:hypothetical protein